ncbi:MAG: ATP-binding protein, partial [Gammaproteobacteria bacterium]|nr:ATP-binding protein [Gammaproteobacteria bacterium]
MKNKVLSQSKKSISVILMLLFVSTVQAAPNEVAGKWYQSVEAGWVYDGQSKLPGNLFKSVPAVSLTGGTFWFQGGFDVSSAGRYVLDFKNSSTIGYFRHIVFDEDGRQVFKAEGGIQNDADNPFFLRHGREMELPPGRYQLISELSSPFYLAQPEPYINNIEDYRRSIKGGNALVLVGLGIFLGLGIYYAALSFSRKRLAEGMYTVFILGNFFYNGIALLVLPHLFGIHWFYLSSTPILFSNAAYIVFVMALLGVNREKNPRLYGAGIAMLGVLGIFALFAALYPNWSMEFARYGVGIFLSYGLMAGIVRARQGSGTAKLYLIAIGAFFVFGGIAISQTNLVGVYTYHMEHIGLFAVTVEIILLGLVLAYQFAQLQREKESIYSDFSEERIRREELAIAKAEADRANQAKSEFLSSMSHELRTPMNAILGFTQLMHYDEDLPKRYAYGVNETLKAGNHLLDLINGVLDLAKVESGRIEMSLEPVNIKSVVDECLRLVNSLAEKRKIKIACEDIEGVIVKADRMRLKQSLINLLSNAIKYNRKGGTVNIEIDTFSETHVRILIKDTGKGIPQRRIKELFQPFNRLDAENSEIEGTGIGLTLTQRLVEQMGGKLGVESVFDRGSCFWIELPVSVSSESAQTGFDGNSNIYQTQHNIKGMHTVLYIEDNPANLKFMEQMLSKRDYINLITAHTPELGFELASTRHPSVILLDINLPGVNSYQVLEKLKSNSELADIPV